MLISHKHKFIFIKTKKTAGTSVEISLSRYCGHNDTITPIAIEDEKIRYSLNIKPQRYYAPLSQYSIRDFARVVLKRRRREKFSEHLAASIIKERIGDKIWNSYYKFCFERNPWDKIISTYWWLKHAEPEKFQNFEEFFESGSFSEYCYNFKKYTDDGSIIVDFVGRYENLSNDLKTACDKIGINFDGWLPNAKGSFRKDKGYRNYLTPEQVQVVREAFSKEIELFDYQY